MSQRKNTESTLSFDNDSSSPKFTSAELAWRHCVDTILHKLTMLYDQHTAHQMLVTYIEDVRYEAHSWHNRYRNKDELYDARSRIITPTLLSEAYQSHWASLEVLRTLTSTSGKNLLEKTQKDSQKLFPSIVTEYVEEEITEKGMDLFQPIAFFVNNLFKENSQLQSKIEEQKLLFKIKSTDSTSGKAKYSTACIYASSADKTIEDLKIKLSKQTGIDIKHLDILWGEDGNLPNDALWRNAKWYGLTEGKALVIDRTPLNNNKNDPHVVVGNSYGRSPVSTSTPSVPMTTAAIIPAATTVEHPQAPQTQEQTLNLASATLSKPAVQPYQEHHNL